MTIRRPHRVIFNFTGRCNMACPFCYVPWDNKPEDQCEAEAVLREVVAWQPASITFGGGDPMRVPWIEELIEMARRDQPDLFIQLDTNGLRLTPERLAILARTVDLLGLPLDAVKRETSLRMRAHPTHFARVMELIPLASKALPLKINTVVSKQNRDEIGHIGAALAPFAPISWSLYQFWPTGPWATANQKIYEISDEEHQSIVTDMAQRFSQLQIERIGSVTDRTNAYLFVTPTGRAYAQEAHDSGETLELGNVLDEADDVLSRWAAVVDWPRHARRAASRAHERIEDRSLLAVRSHQEATLAQLRDRTIIENVPFAGLEIEVAPGVFPPIATDTHLLAEHMPELSGKRLLELTTGSGALSVLAGKRGAYGIACDINPAAVENAGRNFQKHHVAFTALQSDGLTAIPEGELFDVIMLNPPYLDEVAEDDLGRAFFSNHSALLTQLFSRAKDHLTPDGYILLTWPAWIDSYESMADGWRRERVGSRRSDDGQRLYFLDCLHPVR